MNPQYIKLTAVRVTMPPPTNGRGQPTGPAETKILQPPVVQLVPLPIMFNKNQTDGRAERNDGGIAVTFGERFGDVMDAIERAHREGAAIAIPVDAVLIAKAAREAADAASAQIMPLTVQEAVETAVNGVKAALDAEEAANDPREPDGFPAPTGDGSRDLERIGKHMDETGVRWDDFVQTDGENVGEPKYKRRPRMGDLRIHSVVKGRYFLEQAYVDGPDADVEWMAPQLPFPLLRTFDSRDQLIEEVAKAGRESQLINA